ncbi:MAG: response regulator [Burkholderiaceae bacterium]|jgi:CheY-like chemotaxis protein
MTLVATANLESCPILVVDDNVDAADSLVSLLAALGYESCAAYGGLDAVKVSRVRSPKLIFLDIDMPSMDGYETLAEMRRLGLVTGANVVALTARDSQRERQLTREAGFGFHVRKPIENDILCELAEQAAPKPLC